MDKPFTLKVQDLINNITKVINEAEMPAYVIKNVLEKIYEEIGRLDNEEIKRYNESEKKDKKEVK